MKIGDVKHWHQARQRLFWLGWPTTLIRFSSTAFLLSASATVGLLSTANHEESAHTLETARLKQAIAACQALRNAAEHARDEHQSAENSAVGEDPHYPKNALDFSESWLMDSSGRRWIFDKSVDIWRRAP